MSDDLNDDFLDTRWTDESRKRLLDASSDLIAAIDGHREALLASVAPKNYPERTAAAAALNKAAIAYSEAQFNLTGNGFPFGALKPWDHEIDGDDESDDVVEPTQLVSVLYRADFDVVDETAVKVAGRAAYKELNPDLSIEDIERAIGLGGALYQLAHLNGLESLNNAPGLSPLGAMTQVVEPAESLEFDEMNFDPSEPNAAFSVGGSVLFTSEDRSSI